MTAVAHTFLEDISQERYDDELSTMTVGPETDVTDPDGHLIGQVARVHINGHGHRWMARDAWHAQCGDIPGQIMGWAGNFVTKKIATDQLVAAVNERQKA